MIDYSTFKISKGTPQYLDAYENFRYASKNVAAALEAAREGENTLGDNLTINYNHYSLYDNIDGAGTYKCINMGYAIDEDDYVTKQYIVGQPGKQAEDITDLKNDNFTHNDLLIVDTDTVHKRPMYHNITLNTLPLVVEDNDHIKYSGGQPNLDISTPINPIPGTQFTIDSAYTSNILQINSQNNDLYKKGITNLGEIDFDKPYISFTMIYVNSTYGWILKGY